MEANEFIMQLDKMPSNVKFAKQTALLKKRYGKEYENLAQSVLDLVVALGYDPVKVSRAYIYDYLKQLAFFVKNKEYGHGDFEEVKNNVYDNEKIMLKTYMPGFLLTYSYAMAMYRNFHFFLNEFIPKIAENSKGIEVGFGPGFYLWQTFCRCKGITMDGYDISSYAMKFAAHLLESAQINSVRYSLQIGDICKGIDEESQSADFAILSEVIHHMPNPSDGIVEMARILRGGGGIYIFLLYWMLIIWTILPILNHQVLLNK